MLVRKRLWITPALRQASCPPAKAAGPVRLLLHPLQQLTDSLLASRLCEISPEQRSCIGLISVLIWHVHVLVQFDI